MRKPPLKKRTTRRVHAINNIEPTRLAVAALERIRTILVKSGHADRLGPSLTTQELETRARLLGTTLPPSYVGALGVTSKIGDPEVLLGADEIAAHAAEIAASGGVEARRYAPFCRIEAGLVCFDRAAVGTGEELPVVLWQGGSATAVAAHFGEWLDAVADAREESVATAAKMPGRLKRLLYELGFRFEYPVIGRLETGDTEAVAELLGPELARAVRGDVDRLFDPSGKASLTLDVDEFTLTASLRTGIHVFEAEDVFRWLRTFRDENLFTDDATTTSDVAVRDLRRAPREPPLVPRGTIDVAALPAKDLVFRAASGAGRDDLYLLGCTRGAREHARSVVLHVLEGRVAGARKVDAPLDDLHVARDGTVWGLTTTHVVRLDGERTTSYPLRRPTRGRPWWYGIGGSGDRVLVWGAGALLELEGGSFVPFAPDAMLDAAESVVALHAQGLRVWMLVCGDHVGAVARFDSVQWQPIPEDHVIEATLTDLDVWRGTAHVLDREGGVWRIEDGPPARVPLSTSHPAFLTEAGTARELHSLRAVGGGTLLLGSKGGVVEAGAGAPLLHALAGGRDPVRLVRVGQSSSATMTEGEARESAVIALSGPHAWIWQSGTFHAIDLAAW
jgi:hypothetical protein